MASHGSLEEDIRAVFPVGAPPGEILPKTTDYLSGPYCEEEFAYQVKGKTWVDVSQELLDDHESCFHEMTHIARVYYFPAYLLTAIHNPLQLAAQTVKRYLTEPDYPATNEDAEFWLYVLDGLTLEQRDVVRRVLKYLDSTLLSEGDHACISDQHELQKRILFWGYADEKH